MSLTKDQKLLGCLLERLEEQADVEDARKALGEAERLGTISLRRLQDELNREWTFSSLTPTS